MVSVGFVSENLLIKVKYPELESRVGNNMTKPKSTRKTGLITFPIGDFLIRIKNAGRAKYRNVKFPFNKLAFQVAKVLEKEKMLSDVKKQENDLLVNLVYQKKEPVITDIKLVSKPGLRIYMDVSKIAEKKGSSFYIISTSKGVMTSKDAIKNNLGGEVLVEIF
jgi:small subunit ribosomal protein S8